MESNYSEYLQKKSKEELYDILQSLDRDKYPERYEMILHKIKEIEGQLVIEPIENNESQSLSQSNENYTKPPVENQIPTREYASVLTRFGAIVIDGLIMFPFYIPVIAASAFIEEGSNPPAFLMILMVVCILGMIGFGFWNGIIRMGNTGQSLGRKFLNIAVLKSSGQTIGVGKATLREIIGRWISGMICYLGYLNAFWDKKKQMWHDKIADCYVYYVDENFS